MEKNEDYAEKNITVVKRVHDKRPSFVITFLYIYSNLMCMRNYFSDNNIKYKSGFEFNGSFFHILLDCKRNLDHIFDELCKVRSSKCI